MRRRLGKTDIEVTPVGLGCWQFSAGQGLAGKFWEAIPQPVVDQVVEASLAGGINWFDTAEMYGNGASERALAVENRGALELTLSPYELDKLDQLSRQFK